MGTISIKLGYVYFLKLHDSSDEYSFPFYKIGETIDIPDRIKGLQTGNPFQIVEAKSIKSSACNLLEYHLHGIYSSKRVGVEWFKFTDSEFKKVWKQANKFNAYLKEIIPTVQRLEHTESNGNRIEPSDEVKELHASIISLYKKYKKAVMKNEIITYELDILTGKSKGIEGITKVSITDPQPRLDYDILTENIGNKADELIEQETERQRKIMELERKMMELELDLDTEAPPSKPELSGNYLTLGTPRVTDFPEVYEQKMEVKSRHTRIEAVEVIDEILERTSNTTQYHREYLENREALKEIEGQVKISELELRKHCAKNDGIENVCNYKRELLQPRYSAPAKLDEPVEFILDISDLDQRLLVNNFPEEYEASFVQGIPHRTFGIFDYRVYI